MYNTWGYIIFVYYLIINNRHIIHNYVCVCGTLNYIRVGINGFQITLFLRVFLFCFCIIMVAGRLTNGSMINYTRFYSVYPVGIPES